ncbi:MAG: tRNA (adenosine(37)-N6)-threonylcarbamoyltransferase complex ATPase subunit type 1 TsaE [Oscillospiraceae bacterium]|jgi:tRNA threonylcarbamoyladenosine biosynthesis protein TsaE|nr:tRNA (adenosine(37)-N6)-threonylcarbamoyltransferase complex ATPase subunit type 1 TsaE [Oscillospiraceae bacterium]
MVYHSTSEHETVELGRRLGSILRAGAVVALRGGLGAGKTAFSRGIAAALHVRETLTSPTFTIVNEYEGDLPLFHFDMYRVGSDDDLFMLGWDEYLERGGVVVVEWSENIAPALPDTAITVAIERAGENARDITVTGADLWD